ncbi:MAG TPA: fibronectin type III domain-containing protein, partial [Candidatus Enterenecus faecium]|nr:fibronectin type III domain-containing protein [Candidatus Enterenecus faecium]
MLHKNAKKVISGVLGTCLVFQLAALPSLAQTSNVPDQTQTAVTAQENSGVQTLASTSFTDVLLSVGANNTQMNATWYAAQEGAGYVLVAKQSQLVNGVMPENAAKFDATSTPANESGKWSNQATITGLEPGTVYAYQLVNG